MRQQPPPPPRFRSPSTFSAEASLVSAFLEVSVREACMLWFTPWMLSVHPFACSRVLRHMYINVPALSHLCRPSSTLVMPHSHRFLGNSALWWELKNEVTISTPWYLGLVFRTRARDGTLLQAQAGQYISLLFQVRARTHAHTRVHIFLCYLSFNLLSRRLISLCFPFLLLYSLCFAVGDKWPAGVRRDPRCYQTGAFALGSGSRGRRPLARPPAGAARCSQRPRDAICRHAATRFRALSGTGGEKKCFLDSEEI